MTQKQPPVEKEKKIAGRPEAERPEEDAGKKGSVVTPGRVIASIVLVCLIWFTYAVKTVKLNINDDKETRTARDLVLGFAYYEGERAPRNLELALTHFLKAAHAGNVVAQFQVGKILAEGSLLVERDMPAARDWLRKAAEQGHADAWIALGELYAGGVEGSPQDKAKTADWLRKAAGEGNDKAQAALKALEEDMAGDALSETEQLARAYACLEGKGLPKDMDAAARWFRKAAAKGNVDAQWRIAALIQSYDVAEQSRREAENWLRKAAEQGNAEAQCSLGAMLFKGEGMPEDKAQAAEWFRKAAEQGHALAQNNLGLVYDAGEGVAQDKAQAREWFRKAAEQGLEDAQFHLGTLFFKGDGVPQDLHEAARWLRKAAEQGHEEAWQLLHYGDEKLCAADEENRKAERAERERTQREELIRQAQTGDPEKQYNLAQAYHFGHHGLPEDMSQIVAWLRKAGEQGHLSAQTWLASIYYDGEKVPQDKAEAAVWLRKAAGQGDVKSQEKLARMYHTGDGIPRDGKQAVFWYGKLAEKGSVDSMMTIAGIYARGDGVPRDMEQVVVWGREAALLGNTLAPIRLGRMYAEGNGVPRDMDKAILWYHWAARAFNDEAMLELGRIYAEGDGVPQDKWLAAAWYMRIDTGDYRIEEKVRKALQALEVDENVINAWKEVLDSVQETRMEVARFELSRGVDKIGRSEEGKEKFSVLSINAERACSAFLEEWKKLERAGSNIPPQIRDMAASVAFEAEKTLRAIETAGKSEQPAVFL